MLELQVVYINGMKTIHSFVEASDADEYIREVVKPNKDVKDLNYIELEESQQNHRR